MTTTHGIYEYSGAELGAPGPNYMKLLTDSIESALVDVDDAIADVDTLTDSGWVLVTTIGPGWTAVGVDPPRVRRVGDRVDLAGALYWTAGVGSYADMLTIPVGFRLTGAYAYIGVGAGYSENGVVLHFSLRNTTHKIEGIQSTGNPTTVHFDAVSWYVN